MTALKIMGPAQNGQLSLAKAMQKATGNLVYIDNPSCRPDNQEKHQGSQYSIVVTPFKAVEIIQCPHKWVFIDPLSHLLSALVINDEFILYFVHILSCLFELLSELE